MPLRNSKRSGSKISALETFTDSVHMENTTLQSTDFVNGLPVTTKEDKTVHGIGVRSMRRLAEKYGGMLEFSQRDGFFAIEALFSGHS